MSSKTEVIIIIDMFLHFLYSQAIKCEKCSATLDTDHMRDVHAKVLSTPSILILYTNCSTLNEKKKW